MSEKPSKPRSDEKDPDDRLALPLDPVEALRGLLRVDPESEPKRRGERSASRPDDTAPGHPA